MNNITLAIASTGTMDNVTTVNNFLGNISTGSLDSGLQPTGALKIAMDTLLVSLTILLMLSFGCSLEVRHIRHHVTKPISVVLAMLIHFVVIPYVFYAITLTIGLSTYDEVPLVVLATSPSGGIGNLFVNHVDGDVALG